MKIFPHGRSRPSRIEPGLLLAVLASLLVGASAPAGPPAPRAAGEDPPVPLVEIPLASPDAWTAVRGLDLDLIEVRPGFRARALGWPGTEERLRAAGVGFRRVSEDYGLDLAVRNGATVRPGPAPGPRDRFEPSGTAVWNLPPFGEGSLAGFWTFAEVAAFLDSVAATDSRDLVSEVDTIGWSLQGRPILALLVTDHARPLGTRPEVLLTALTHAREPQGMQSALLFLIRLLDGYGVDPVVTYLVQEREIWFVPVVNPDGYVRNQNTWESTGSYGLWRKNLRNNDGNPAIGNSDGVDLNRNFGFQWGYDDVGSSPLFSSQTYRGPGPFSEPETQVLRDFCLAHGFRIAQNFHTFWEACLYPWGYISLDTPDADRFERIADAMTDPSRYAYGRSGQVLYAVNGEANDWMYGDPAKPSILAFTTEVGNQDDGFWPPASRIVPLAESQLPGNLVLAYAASVYLTADSLVVESSDGLLRPGEIGPARFRIRHDGLADATAGEVTVQVTSSSAVLGVVEGIAVFPALDPGESAWPAEADGILLAVDPKAAPGTRAELILEIADAGAYVGRDTLFLRIGEPVVVFSDDAKSGLAAWVPSGTWGVESVDGDPAFSDSPGGNYLDNIDFPLTLAYDLDLSGAAGAVLQFRTQWNIEVGFDFGRVEASTDGGNLWTPLAGHMSRPGHGITGGYTGGVQPLGLPGYDGNQRFWADEEIDLNAYAGLPSVRVRFRISSDGGFRQDGWLIDDVRVLAYAPGLPLAVGDHRPSGRPLLTATPNPVRSGSEILYTLEEPSTFRVAVHDVAGREVRVLSEGLAGAGPRRVHWDGTDSGGRPVASGSYFVRLQTPGGDATAKLLVIR